MVNVPGRSKGCKTCRTKKVKCSLERPECKNCIKSGRVCLGYQRDRVFVHSDVTREAEKSLHHIRDKPAMRQNTELIRKSCLPKGASHVERIFRGRVDSLYCSDSTHGLVSASLCQQMLGSYVSRYRTTPVATATDGCAWLTAIPSIPSPTKALMTAAYAVSLSRLGAISNTKDMQQESLRLYTQGLHCIQKALLDPKLMYSDEILAACTLLAMYEVFQCPSNSRSAYISHQEGCAKLIQLRGPSAHVDGLGHSIFLWYRYMGTITALDTKSTFLSDIKWKTLPFTKFTKDPIHRVLDVLLDAPVIFKRSEQMQTMPPADRIPIVIDIIRSCLCGDQAMEALLLELELRQAGPLYWPMMASQPGDADDLFPISYTFPNFCTSTTMVLSWSTLAILWSGLCHLYHHLGELTPLTPTADGKLTGNYTVDGENVEFSLPLASPFSEFPTMAGNVCRSVDFCLPDELGSVTLAGPLTMVIQSLRSWPRFEKETAWAKDMLVSVQKRGIKMFKYY